MPSIQELIAKARNNTSQDDLVRIDSLNNAYKIRELSTVLQDTTGIDSTNIPPAVFDKASENVKKDDYFSEGGHEFTKEEYEIFGPTQEKIPSKPYVSESWSFAESPVGEELSGGQDERKWFLNPHISFREWYSDVGRGTADATLFGKPVKGISTDATLYNPSGEPGEEKYNKKYVDELIRRMSLLENPQEKIATGPSGMVEGEGRLLTRITGEDRGFGYEGIFPEEMHWKSNPELRGSWLETEGGQRYGSTPEAVGPYVKSPEYQNILFAEKSKYYHDALNALERIDGELPSAKKLSAFIERDQWTVFDPEHEPEGGKYKPFLPISEDIANLEGWGRNPFEDVDASLDSLKKYTTLTEDSTAVDIEKQGIPSAWFDPATEPASDTTLFVEDMF